MKNCQDELRQARDDADRYRRELDDLSREEIERDLKRDPTRKSFSTLSQARARH